MVGVGRENGCTLSQLTADHWEKCMATASLDQVRYNDHFFNFPEFAPTSAAWQAELADLLWSGGTCFLI